MLAQLDELLRTVLMRDVSGLSTADQVRFQPPDDDWRTSVANLGRNALNVYLVDLRENRALRDNEWVLTMGPDGPHREVGPARVDCHYLISAWSPATVTPATEPTLDEHTLLYQAMAALFRADPLNPSRVYPPGSAALAAVDPLIRDADLPVSIVPAEGWPKIAEFWGAMGSSDRWKPAIWYTVTIPVALTSQLAGPPVTTRIIEFRQGNDPVSGETWTQIGGTVSAPGGSPMAGAVVAITGAGGPVGRDVTDADGRFSVGALHLGSYHGVAGHPGHPDAARDFTVPDDTGDYDFTLT
jgi:hypothetical protein